MDQADDTIRIAAISDLHHAAPNIDALRSFRPDLVAIAGDLCATHLPSKDLRPLGHRHPDVEPYVLASQHEYLCGPFCRTLTQICEELGLTPQQIIVAAGNHDRVLEIPYFGPKIMESIPCTYLVNERHEVEVRGRKLVIWASPMSPTYQDWSFMADDVELAEVWAQIPKDADIVITHSPPYGCVDKVHPYDPADTKLGCETLRQQILISQPPVLICGHIHPSGGLATHLGESLIVNAAAAIEHVDDPNRHWNAIKYDLRADEMERLEQLARRMTSGLDIEQMVNGEVSVDLGMETGEIDSDGDGVIVRGEPAMLRDQPWTLVELDSQGVARLIELDTDHPGG